MQIALACSIAGIDQEDAKCNPEKLETKNWKAVIDGIKGGEGSASTLLSNMKEAGYSVPEYPDRISGLGDLFACRSSVFPCQSHHLIPEKQLPDLKVTGWLTDSPKSKCKLDDYKLTGDTNYDTNGAENGYFMPFASTTYQWNKTASVALKNKICFEMMRLTGIQLHQGRHSSSKDYSEDLDVEEFAPYKKQVKTFLDEVEFEIASHIKGCDICKKNGPEEIPPLQAAVAMVNQVSSLLRVLLQRGTIVVSARAGAYRNKYAPEGKGFKHPKEPFCTPEDFK